VFGHVTWTPCADPSLPTVTNSTPTCKSLVIADKAQQSRWWRGGSGAGGEGEEAGRPGERERRAGLRAHGAHVAAAAQRHALRRGGRGRDPGPDGRGRGVRRGRRGAGGGRRRGAGRGVLAPRGRHAPPGRVRAAQRGQRRARPLLLPPGSPACRSELPCCLLAVALGL
jgi:hypothetical protein